MILSSPWVGDNKGWWASRNFDYSDGHELNLKVDEPLEASGAHLNEEVAQKSVRVNICTIWVVLSEIWTWKAAKNCKVKVCHKIHTKRQNKLWNPI